MYGYNAPGTMNNFFAWNSSDQVWRTDSSVYETWTDANYALYSIAATPQGTTSNVYSASPPTGSVRYDMRQHVDGTPAKDFVVFEAEVEIASGQLPGYVAINQNTGGTNNLQITSNGNPVAGATIRVFLKSAYDASPTTAAVIGSTTTDANGDWVEPVFVPPGQTYAIVVSAIGNNTLETAVTV